MKLYCALFAVVGAIFSLVSGQCITGEMRSHSYLCDRYLICDNGVFIEMLCPSGLVFNPELNVCDWPSNVDCANSTETTPSWNQTSPSWDTTTLSTTVTTTSVTTSPPSYSTTPTWETATVPLYRLYQSSTRNHFYTTSSYEADNAVSNLNYILEGIAGLVSASPADCQLIPVHRLVVTTATIHNHFYTTDEQEAANAESTLGYIREGIAFYCASSINICGASSPFYRYYLQGNHFYTTNISEGNDVVGNGGTFEGIMCYIWS